MARILINGGSLGGLLAANMLLREGHEVQVLEKATGSLDGRGAGIVTHTALHRALVRAGVSAVESLGVHVESRVALDASGAVAARLALPQVLTSWSRLYALLREALPGEHYRQGVALQRVEQHAGGVRVHADSGAVFEADLLIASDGIRSTVRSQFAPHAVAQYAGYVAWRGVCDEAVLSNATLGSVFDHFGFGLPPGEQLIGYPVAGHGNATARGRRRYNFVWYRPADEHGALRELLTDADGTHHPLGIPPHKVSWRQVAAMREAARRLLAPQFAEILEKAAQPFLQPIHDVVSQRLAFGRVALMGDAAFVARPHVGMGVTKAAQDAMDLADCIRVHGATAAALQAYEALRLAPGLAVVQRARELGAYLQAQGQGGGAAVRRDADAVLRETAVDPSGTRVGPAVAELSAFDPAGGAALRPATASAAPVTVPIH
ncbi:MAG: FAD-dependent monooxygenase [Burkholderiales bacterium]|nr:FAD-dependent monooxygenase [Burkholderiales bacterium]